MKVYALTPTGGRPEGLALLGEYINAQTYKRKFTWVIVDDCDPATYIPKMRDGIDVIVIRPDWRWKPGMNTHARNMEQALDHVPADSVCFIFEDDDIYLPGYIEAMLESISDSELIGEIDSRYYNAQTGKHKILKGRFHSSLASTVCRGSALQSFRDLCETGIQKMIDVTLWKNFNGKKKLLQTRNVIGIKGMPGRAGIGIGHRHHFGSAHNKDTLRAWAGDYAANYDIFRRAK